MYNSIEEKAFNRVARKYIFRKTGIYFSHPVLDGLTEIKFFGYSRPSKIDYPRGKRKFRNILPGLFKRLKKTQKACGYLGKFSIDSYFSREILHLEAPITDGKYLDDFKKLFEWNMAV